MKRSQTSGILALPEHVLVQIASYLLPTHPEIPPPLLKSNEKDKPTLFSGTISPSSVHDFVSLRHTCSKLYDLSLPRSIWSHLVTASAQHTVLSLNRPSKDNTYPGHRVTSSSFLFQTLNINFVEPVITALQAATGETDTGQNGENGGHTPRDVWEWWMYDPTWRNRRRVWSAVIHGVSVAREADWWYTPHGLG